jgi:hypothetical protein
LLVLVINPSEIETLGLTHRSARNIEIVMGELKETLGCSIKVHFGVTEAQAGLNAALSIYLLREACDAGQKHQRQRGPLGPILLSTCP